jgi:hypothetical protein
VGGKLKARALRLLAQEELGLTIQQGEHDSVDDARASLYVYLKHKIEWEKWVRKGRGKGAGAAGGLQPQRAKSLVELAKNAEHLADL